MRPRLLVKVIHSACVDVYQGCLEGFHTTDYAIGYLELALVVLTNLDLQGAPTAQKDIERYVEKLYQRCNQR